MARVRPDANEIQCRSAELCSSFPALWHGVVDEWAEPRNQPRLWLMYSASYLGHTGGVRWAIDPVRLHHRLPAVRAVDYAADLQPLSLILLTHQHGDHLDLELIRSLRSLPITWVVPEFLVPLMRAEVDLPAGRLLVPRSGAAIDFSGLRITPFEGMHWEDSPDGRQARVRGVPAMGYLLEHGGKSWLFPGDTRTYAACELPSFPSVDVLFAHLWLGRASARLDPPPLLEAFCRWCIDLHPSIVVLTHLEEFGRDIDDFWTREHAQVVASRLHELRPEVEVLLPAMGESIAL